MGILFKRGTSLFLSGEIIKNMFTLQTINTNITALNYIAKV